MLVSFWIAFLVLDFSSYLELFCRWLYPGQYRYFNKAVNSSVVSSVFLSSQYPINVILHDTLIDLWHLTCKHRTVHRHY